MGITDITVDFSPRYECGHGVDDDHIDATGADQNLCNFQGLLAKIGLRDEQVVDIDPESFSIIGVQRMFGVDECRGAASFLGFGNCMQGQGGLAA
jgi:hypothetical protein